MDKAQLGLVSQKRMRPCFNCLSQSMDTHRKMDAPSHSAHPYTYTHISAHTPTQRSTYAGPINTAPLQWTSGGNLQGPEHYYYNPRPTTCVQPAQMRANHRSPLNSTMHTTRTHDAHTPTGPPCSGFSLQSTPPTSPGHVSLRQTPPRATEPLRTRPASSPDEPRSITGGFTPLSSVFPLVLSEPSNLFPGDDPIGWPLGPLATDYMLNFPPPNGSIAWDGAICTTHSQAEGSHARGEDASFSSYHYEEPISTPQYNRSLSSILIPKDHLLPSVPLWSTLDGFPLVEDPSPQLPRPFLQANLTASGHTPNSGGGQNCSDVNFNVDTAHSNGNPVSFKSNHQLGSDRSGRTHTKRGPKPYQRPTPSVTPKTRPVKYDDNLERLQERCRKQGADEGAIGLLGKVFANGVSEAALTRSLTDEEVETRELGIVTGKVYTVFLEPTNEGKGAAHRYICRLCHSDQTWKNAKDVVRHLKRDHFGFADSCEKWYVFDHLLTFANADSRATRLCSGQKSYTKGEGTRHRCK